MAYCTTDDLILGDTPLGTIDASKYVDNAFTDMNSRLGYVYELPITASAVAEHQWDLLKKINTFIASGRLIMAQAAGAEDNALHSYGLSLVQEGFADLGLILDGSLPLSATPVAGSAPDSGPTITNRDEYSGVELFEDNFYTSWTDGWGQGAMWRPGSTG